MPSSFEPLPDLFSALPKSLAKTVVERSASEQEILKGISMIDDRSLARLSRSVRSLSAPCRTTRDPLSEILTEGMAAEIAVSLRLHHGTTTAPLTKLAFEAAFCDAASDCGLDAQLSPPNTPSLDVVLEGRRISLKTEAHKNIKSGKLLISKLMELGAGEWTDRPEDFEGLKAQVSQRLQGIDMIVVFRRLMAGRNNYYEMLSIDPALLLEALPLPVLIKHDSRNSVKPAEIDVRDEHGDTKFRWKFDGGGERKLTIEHLRRDLCQFHGSWLLEPISARRN